jgi:hypothetical protein
MFVGGLNKVGSGGVVLQTIAPASSIIAAPSAQSIYPKEFEFTVDRRDLVTSPLLSFSKTSNISI